MKTTPDLNHDLLAEAGISAAQQRRSPTRLTEKGLQVRLTPTPHPMK